MERLNKILLIAGLVISALFGSWHFIIPYMFGWYGYIPNAPREIIVSVDWINFFFSLLLTGISVLLIVQRKLIIAKNKPTYGFFALLLATWLSRVLITIVHPWHLPYQTVDIIQLAVFILEFLLLSIPFFYFIFKKT